MNDRELTALCERLGVTPEGRERIEHIRRSDPARRVQAGPRHVVSRFGSRKMGCTLQAESQHGELAALVLWEYDAQTFEIYCQPPQIKVDQQDANGKQHKRLHTFDFFLIQANFIGWVECKLEDWLQQPRKRGTLYMPGPDGTWRCPPGEAYAKPFGLGFKVRSSKETNPLFLRNVEFLADYLDTDCPPPDPDIKAEFLAQFQDRSYLVLKELLRQGDEQAKNDVLYKLIADRALYFDLDRQLITDRQEGRVFRDEAAAVSYRAAYPDRVTSSLDALRIVNLETGQDVVWDGQHWTIANVGETQIFLVNHAGKTVPLSLGDFERHVDAGAMTATLAAASAAEERGRALHRGASPAAMKLALWRHRHLTNTLEPGDKPAGVRALQKWRRMQAEGRELYGNDFFGLIGRNNLGNRKCRLDPAVQELVAVAVADWRDNQDSKSRTMALAELSLQCEELHLEAPSEKAFRRACGKESSYAVKLGQEGAKAAYPLEPPEYLERLTPKHGERAFQVGHIDHTCFDLQLIGYKHHDRLSKAWLTLFVDTYTRKVLSYWFCYDPPSYCSSMVVIRECLAKHGRVPKVIMVDNGPDFDSVYFETLVAACTSTKKSRKTSKPRDGSVIERLFGVANTEFAHCLRGNNTPLQHPRSMSKTHDPRERAIWSLRDLTAAFDNYLENVYHEDEHPALGVSPNEAMRVSLETGGLRNHKKIAFTETIRIMCLPAVKKHRAKVHPGRGVHVNYHDYWCPQFAQGKWENVRVPVRYDPYNLARAYAFLDDEWVPLRCIEVDAELEGVSEREMRFRSADIMGRKRKGGERRKKNLKRRAKNMRSVRSTEAVLLQQRRDEERKAAEALSTSPAPIASPPQLTIVKPKSAQVYDLGDYKPVVTPRGAFK